MSDTPKRNDFLAESLGADEDMNLEDFAVPTPAKPRPDPEIVNEVSKKTGMPSREPKPTTAVKPVAANRRFRTGRNIQLNLKVTSEVRDEFYAIADKLELPLGAVLEAALASLNKHSK